MTSLDTTATMTGMTRTILIVDDHPEFRAAARALLEADGWTIAGEAGDGTVGLELARALHPDVVLLDIALPDTDGFAVAEVLAAEAEPPAVILVSSREGTVYGRRLDRAPIRGFLPKRSLSGQAVAALLG